MTNGEKMQEMFPEGKTRRCRGGVVFESDGWCHAYDSDWWNTEHKEPTTRISDLYEEGSSMQETEMGLLALLLIAIIVGISIFKGGGRKWE